MTDLRSFDQITRVAMSLFQPDLRQQTPEAAGTSSLGRAALAL